jgi:hypothetical protein
VKNIFALVLMLLVTVVIIASFASVAKADGNPCSGTNCKPAPPAVSLAG